MEFWLVLYFILQQPILGTKDLEGWFFAKPHGEHACKFLLAIRYIEIKKYYSVSSGCTFISRDEFERELISFGIIDVKSSEMTFMKGQNYEIIVPARGTPALGEKPLLELKIGEGFVRRLEIGQEEEVFKIKFSPAKELKAPITLDFKNDYFDPVLHQDRNIYLRGIFLN